MTYSKTETTTSEFIKRHYSFNQEKSKVFYYIRNAVQKELAINQEQKKLLMLKLNKLIVMSYLVTQNIYSLYAIIKLYYQYMYINLYIANKEMISA